MLKYDIPTLLALRQNACAEIDKLRPSVLQSNILMQRSVNIAEPFARATVRSRNASNLSRGSEQRLSTSGKSLRLPSRQPSNPPRGVLAQTDVGFARFLRQHSSPKHKRVTAGGRIVPMAPSASPPKMNQLANTQGTKGCSTSLRGERGQKASKLSIRDPEKKKSASGAQKPPPPLTETAVDQDKQSNGDVSSWQHSHGSDNLSNLPATSVYPTMTLHSCAPFHPVSQHLSPGAKTQRGLGGSPSCVAYGPRGDQITWLPNANVPFNLQSASMPRQPHLGWLTSSSEFSAGSDVLGARDILNNTTLSDPGSIYPVFSTIAYPFAGNPVLPISQLTPFELAPSEGSDLAILEGAMREYEALSTQLSHVDKYMAIHTWNLDPQLKAALVEQRMSLVRELDAVRLYKEQLESLFEQERYERAKAPLEAGTQACTGQLLQKLSTGSLVGQSPKLYSPNALVVSPASTTSAFQQVAQMNGHFPASYQWACGEGLYPLDNSSTNSGHLGTELRLPYSLGEFYRELTYSTASRSSEQGAQNLATRSADKEASCTGYEWSTSTELAPPDIDQIYRRIENAENIGVSVNGPPQEIVQVSAEASRLTALKQDEAKQDKARHPTLRSCKDGRPWKSESGPYTYGDGMKGVPCEIQEAPEPWTVSSSATGSWDTVQEENRSCISETQINRDSEKDKVSLSQPAVTSAILSESSVVSHDAVSLDCKQSIKDAASISGSNSARYSGAQLLMRYFGKEFGNGSRKSTPLAVQQNVNAHAFLPSFDGAADSADLSDGHRFLQDYSDNTHGQGEVASGSKQKKTQWYMRKERTKASPATVREFFRRIKEEEQNMIHEYKTADQIAWPLG